MAVQPTTAEMLIAQAEAAILMTRDEVRDTFSMPPGPLEVAHDEAPTVIDVMSASRNMPLRSWISGPRSYPTQQPIEHQLPITSGGLRNAMPASRGV